MKAMLLVSEVLWWTLFVLFYGSAGWVVRRIVIALPIPWPFALPLALPVGALTIIAMAGIVRLGSLRLKAGVYEKDDKMMHLVWGWHYLLARLVFGGPMLAFIQYSPVLRWFAWNAMGGKVAFGSMMSSDITIPEISLFEMGEGSLLGSRSRLSTHSMEAGKLILGPITLGKNVVLAAECAVGPETHFADGAKLMYGVQMVGRTTVGKNAYIGKAARIAGGCVIGEGAVVETESKVPNDTVIPPGGRWENPRDERPVGRLVEGDAEKATESDAAKATDGEASNP